MVQNLSRLNRVARASGRTVFGDVTYAPGGLCGPRVQPDFQLVVVYSGSAQVTLNGQPSAIPEGYAALMHPGRQELFEFDRARPTHHSWCAVAPSLVAAELASALGRAPFALPLTARLQSLIELGLSVARQELPAGAALIDQLGLALMHQYLFEAQTLGSAALPDPVQAAQSLIAARLAEPLSVAVIAHEVGVTPQHLIKLFRRALGITPAKYIWRARVRRGVELLGATGLSIEQVSAQSGFQNAFHFSRLVKQHYGQPPRALRALAWSRGVA